MTLSHEQIETVKQGGSVRLTAPEIGTDCILVRADVYEMSQSAPDDGLSMEQVARLVEADMRTDDELDPLLDSYQQYRQ